MRHLPELFLRNRRWSEACRREDPRYFERLAEAQDPSYLWIGCSDSRVPANQIVDLPPGEVFVHRNVANLVVTTDLNCLSVIQFAVEVLRVRHIIVCGHHGCAGVRAALRGERHGLVDNWLGHVEDIVEKHQHRLAGLSEEERLSRLCEWNVVEQVENVGHTTIVRDAWRRGQDLAVHGWIYSLHDGLLQDLDVTATSQSELLQKVASHEHAGETPPEPRDMEG
jgi:carbonic anhydrase